MRILVALLALTPLCVAEDSLRVWMEKGDGTPAGNYGSVMAEGVLDGKEFYGMVSQDYMTLTTAHFLCLQAGYAGVLSYGKHSYADQEVMISRRYGESVGFALDNLKCPSRAASLSDCSVIVGEDGEGFYSYYWRGLVLLCSDTPVDCTADYADSTFSVSLQKGQGIENGHVGSIVMTGHFGPHDISGMINSNGGFTQDTLDFLCRAAGFTSAQFKYGWGEAEGEPRLDRDYGDSIGFGIEKLDCPAGADNLCECKVFISARNNWSYTYNHMSLKCTA